MNIEPGMAVLRECAICDRPDDEFVQAVATALLYDADVRAGLAETMDLHRRLVECLERLENAPSDSNDPSDSRI